MNNLITLFWSVGGSVFLIIASFVICKLFDYFKVKIKTNSEERKIDIARTKIVDGIIKNTRYHFFFKERYMKEEDETTYIEDQEEEEGAIAEEIIEFHEIYERRAGGLWKNKNDDGYYDDFDFSTTYTQTDDYSTNESANNTMTATGEITEEVYVKDHYYEYDLTDVSSEEMVKKILEKIRDNHDNDLIKERF